MPTTSQVASFLTQTSTRNVTSPLADADIASLEQLGLLQRMTADQMAAVRQQLATLEAERLNIDRDTAQRGIEAAQVEADTRHTHSVLFHLHGVDAQRADLERLDQEQAALRALDEDLAKHQQQFAQFLVQKSLVDQATPYAGGFVSITTAGRTALRDLNVRLYRVGDQEFSRYWEYAKQVDSELGRISYQAATLVGPLSTELATVERSYLWAVAIGMVKLEGDLQARYNAFLAALRSVASLSDNVEDRLMTAEIVSVLPTADPSPASLLGDLRRSVVDLGVPKEVALGVAAILLLGRRADGTFATDPLRTFLGKTRSYESAALLAIVNRPVEELSAKFDYLRSLYASWGYSASEDTELSSAYLASSELPTNSVAPKLAILARGLATYLMYPLVGASILASIPVLEANETLNLLEKAYEILGQRTGPMSQAELITLAIRLIHGLRVQSVDELDPTARAAPPSFSYAGVAPRIWMPVWISHHVYFATFSGIGGAHAAHMHYVPTGGGFVG